MAVRTWTVLEGASFIVRYQLYPSHNLEFSNFSPLISKVKITIIPIVPPWWCSCENSTDCALIVVNNQSLHCHLLTTSGDLGKLLLGKGVTSCLFHVLSLIFLCFLFPIVPSCWLHLKQGFIWSFLGPVCAIISVSEYMAPVFLIEEAPEVTGSR